MWEMLIADEEGDPWGKVYKIAPEKMKETQLVTLEKKDGTMTRSVQETLERLIEGLLSDDREEESEDQKEIRIMMIVESNGPDEMDFTEKEMTASISQLRNRKADGYDGIKSEVIKRMFGGIKGTMLNLYKKMLRDCRFPDVWKVGVVKVFLTSEDKDPSKVKSFRPVTLLPVLGKIGERMIAKILKQWMELEDRMNSGQYGFTGVGTVDALLDMRGEVEKSEKYVVGLFLDISGAFEISKNLSLLGGQRC